MMRVLLIVPRHNYPDRAPSFAAFPMGMPYIAGALKEAGHEVRGLNPNFRYAVGSVRDELERRIRLAVDEFQPELIGTGGLSAEYACIRDIVAICREVAPNVPVVLGGGILTSDLQFIMHHLRPDFGVHGEGEETIVELCERISAGGDKALVAGLAYWQGSELIFNGKRKQSKKIEHLPMPSYDEFAIDEFFAISDHGEGNGGRWAYYTDGAPRVLPVSAARGCPFPCTFCTHPAAQLYRVRTIDDVIKEIIFYTEKYKCNAISLYDELFSVREERVYEFCSGLKEKNVSVKWSAQLRVDAVSLEMLKTMKDAGCQWISFGFESADQSVLDSMKKKTYVEQIRRAVDLSNEAGLGVVGAFIFGDPAETPDTIAASYEFYNKYCRDLNVYLAKINVYPDTTLFRYAEANGHVPDRARYYETITRQNLNLTGMPDGLFKKLTGPITQDHYDYPMAKDVRFERVELPEATKRVTESALNYRRYAVRGACHQCGGAFDFVVGRHDDISTTAGLYAALRPWLAHCPHCHKRMLIDMSSMVGAEETLPAFVHGVNALSRRADWPPVVVINPASLAKLDSWKSYGLRLDLLNLVGFLDRELSAQKTRVLNGIPLLQSADEAIAEWPEVVFVLLPSAEDVEMKAGLLAQGVPAERIIMLAPLSTDCCR